MLSDRDSLIIGVVCGVCAVVLLVFGACYVRKFMSLAQTRKNIDSRMRWKLTHRKSLRGNFIMKFDTPIEKTYHLENKYFLGKGSFGVVVVGTHRETYVQYAIKCVVKTIEKRHRIERELRLLKDVDHVNIVRLFAIYETTEQIHFVMELCTGGTLLNLIDRQPKKYVPEQQAKVLIRQLVSAIAHMHQRGICHRDIKLQNILMENYHPSAQLKLIDFGFGTRFVGVTPLKTRCGTLYTTAPEVLRESYDEKCDVWSGGVVAYNLLCGKRPFEALEISGPLANAGRTSLVTNILMGRYSFNHPAWRSVTPQCIQFIERMLQPDYKHRWSARQALDSPWLSLEDHNVQSETLAHVVRNLRRQSSHTALQQSGMLAVVFNLPTIRTAEIREMFKEFDTDHSGALSREEFQLAMQRTSNLITDDINHLFDVIDVDGDKQISFTEFLAGTLDPRAVDIEQLNTAFQLLDRDNKGYITTDDLHRVLSGKKEERTEIKRRHSEAWTPPTLMESNMKRFPVAPMERVLSNQDIENMTAKKSEFGSSSDVEYSYDHKKSFVAASRVKQDEIVRRRSFAGNMLAPVAQEMDQKVVMKIRQVMEVCDTDGDGVISYAGEDCTLCMTLMNAEFLWAMADGDGKIQEEEETPNIIRGVSRDDLAGVLSPKSAAESMLRRGASEPAMVVKDDMAVSREKAKIKKQHSTFLDALVNYTPKKSADGINPKPSPKSVSPSYPLRPVRVTPMQELPELFNYKHEEEHGSGSSHGAAPMPVRAAAYAKHRSASISTVDHLRTTESKHNILHSMSDIGHISKYKPMLPTEEDAMPRNDMDVQDNSDKSVASSLSGSGILKLRRKSMGIFTRPFDQSDEKHSSNYQTCSEDMA